MCGSPDGAEGLPVQLSLQGGMQDGRDALVYAHQEEVSYIACAVLTLKMINSGGLRTAS